MACSKYTLTNTGSTTVNFNYQRCDDTLWQYQIELLPGQTKNIWLVNGTYSSAQLFQQSIVLINDGAFPPPQITPTPSVTPTLTPTPTVTSTVTPTPTVTSTVTPTPSVTASVTPTITPTMTVTPTNSRNSFAVTSGTTAEIACQGINPTTIWGEDPAFDANTQFYNSASGPVSIDMTGYYSDGTDVVQVDSTGTTVGFFTICNTPTPTPTITQTPTVTSTVTPTASVTPTITPTQTQTPTPSIGYYTYVLGTGTTTNDACNNFNVAPQTLFGTLAGGIGPNIGETLYLNSSLTTPATNAFYSNGTALYQITGGLGQITAVEPDGCVGIVTPTPTITTTPTITPTVTETVTPTPSITPTETVTPTPTNTETPTQTPTPTTTVTPTNARFSFLTTSGATSYDACHGGSSVSIWGDNVNFDQNIFFYDSATGPVTTDMAGFYSYNGVVTEVDSDGSQLGVFTLCASPTPTPTVTPTASVTPTVTPTLTPTPTQTIGYYTYSLGFDAISAGLACNDFSSSPSNYYAPLIGGPGPNVGEFLYTDSTTTTPAPDGYYSNGVAWYLITGGAGEVTSTDPNGCSNLPTSTPTPTVTPTISLTPTQTPTITPTNTSTPTPTPTQIPNMIGDNQSTGDSAIIEFVDDGGTISLSILSGAFPVSSGQTLNAVHGGTFGNPRASITGSSVNYIVELNGSFLLSGTTNPPSVIGLTSGGVALLDTDVSKITLLD
jgi:hypothetical protein